MSGRLGSVTAGAVGTLLSCAVLARAEPTPSVKGPDDGQPTLTVTLPGPDARLVRHALTLDFDGECLELEPLALGVEHWLEPPRVHRRISISVIGEQRPLLGARFWLLVDGQRASLRRFEDFSGTCAELQSSLSAAIALAIEAVDFSEFPEPPPPKPKPVLPPIKLTARSPLHRDPPSVATLPPKRRRAGALQAALVGAQVLGGVGVAPGSSVGLGLRGDLEFNAGVGARLGANYVWTDAVAIADGTLSAVTLAAQLGVCWGGQNLELRAKVCLDAWAGPMTGHPESLERATNQTLPWVALAPGAEVRVSSTENLGVHLGAQLTFNLVRPRFEVLYNTRDELLDQRTVAPMGLIGTLGLDWLLL